VLRSGPTVPHARQRTTTLPPSTWSATSGPRCLCSHLPALLSLFRVTSRREPPKPLTIPSPFFGAEGERGSKPRPVTYTETVSGSVAERKGQLAYLAGCGSTDLVQ
jgi:hypothetical protein